MNVDHKSENKYPCSSTEGQTEQESEVPMIVSFRAASGPEFAAAICEQVIAAVGAADSNIVGANVNAEVASHPASLGDVDGSFCSLAIQSDGSYSLSNVVDLIRQVDGVEDVSASVRGMRSAISRATLIGADRS